MLGYCHSVVVLPLLLHLLTSAASSGAWPIGMTAAWAAAHRVAWTSHLVRRTNGIVQKSNLLGAAVRLQTGLHSMTARSSSSSSSTETRLTRDERQHSVAIVGGGLAGLATCHFWLDKIMATASSSQQSSSSSSANNNYKVVIYDVQDKPGVGGASAVAGGLVHPLSPRGKLVYQGLEGLAMSNQLIGTAIQATKDSSDGLENSESIVLSESIWRCAQNAKQVKQLKKTAMDLPQLCQWLEGDELQQVFPIKEAVSESKTTADASTESTPLLGALRMSHGCRVIHVPSYLQGLWLSCQQKAIQLNQSSQEDNQCGIHVHVEWKPLDSVNIQQELNEYGTVVLSSGASIFQTYLKRSQSDSDSQDQQHIFPVQLVRGQSIEFTSLTKPANSVAIQDAFLCGKYVSPLPPLIDEKHKEPRCRVLVGATHEFKSQATPQEEVEASLKGTTEFMVPRLWDESRYVVDRFTEGYRVQSQRGKFGRLPLIGKLDDAAADGMTNNLLEHKNLWIYTGLSSRGILYHALFARRLVDAAWDNDEASMMEKFPELTWWKP